jgi:pyruvate formate-lyase activating enzyme-like uncharacterized protein
MKQKLIAPLNMIREHNPRLPSTIGELQAIWQAHISAVKESVPETCIEANGEIVYLGDLSPGCHACKQGTWDCVFITSKCNISCSFCYSPHAVPQEFKGSVFGKTPEQMMSNHRKTHITGISFSGGEPFLEPHRLLDWFTEFKTRCPDKYYWVYTNGLLASEEILRCLGALGLDEIRFNAAATGYTHPDVMRNIKLASRFIPNITVEIPAIPTHEKKLLSSLEAWCEAGVKYLNLHELMYEPGTNADSMRGARLPVVTEDGHYTEIAPESRTLILKTLQFVRDNHLPLSINECSLQSKIRQIRGRRKSLEPLTKAPYEKMLRGQLYESCCAYQNGNKYNFFHPDSLSKIRQQPDTLLIRLVRSAPLSMDDPGKWVAFDLLTHYVGE